MYHRSQIQPLSISVSKAFPRFHPSFPVRREPIVSGNGTHNPAYIAVGNAKSLDLNLFFSALRLVCSTAWIQPSCTPHETPPAEGISPLNVCYTLVWHIWTLLLRVHLLHRQMSLEDLRAEISADRQFRGSKQMARMRWRENEILPFHVVKGSRFVRFHVFLSAFLWDIFRAGECQWRLHVSYFKVWGFGLGSTSCKLNYSQIVCGNSFGEKNRSRDNPERQEITLFWETSFFLLQFWVKITQTRIKFTQTRVIWKLPKIISSK